MDNFMRTLELIRQQNTDPTATRQLADGSGFTPAAATQPIGIPKPPPAQLQPQDDLPYTVVDFDRSTLSPELQGALDSFDAYTNRFQEYQKIQQEHEVEATPLAIFNLKQEAGSFIDGISKGISMLGASAAGLTQAVGEVTGIEALKDVGFRWGLAFEEAMANPVAGAVTFRPDDYWKYVDPRFWANEAPKQIVYQLPSIISSLALAATGVGSPAAGAMQTVKLSNKALQGARAADAVNKTAQAATLTGVMNAVQQFGQVFGEESRKYGGDSDIAMSNAVGVGIGTGLMSAASVGIMGAALGKPLTTQLLHAMASGGTEVADYVIEASIRGQDIEAHGLLDSAIIGFVLDAQLKGALIHGMSRIGDAAIKKSGAQKALAAEAVGQKLVSESVKLQEESKNADVPAEAVESVQRPKPIEATESIEPEVIEATESIEPEVIEATESIEPEVIEAADKKEDAEAEAAIDATIDADVIDFSSDESESDIAQVLEYIIYKVYDTHRLGPVYKQTVLDFVGGLYNDYTTNNPSSNGFMPDTELRKTLKANKLPANPKLIQAIKKLLAAEGEFKIEGNSIIKAELTPAGERTTEQVVEKPAEVQQDQEVKPAAIQVESEGAAAQTAAQTESPIEKPEAKQNREKLGVTENKDSVTIGTKSIPKPNKQTVRDAFKAFVKETTKKKSLDVQELSQAYKNTIRDYAISLYNNLADEHGVVLIEDLVKEIKKQFKISADDTAFMEGVANILASKRTAHRGLQPIWVKASEQSAHKAVPIHRNKAAKQGYIGFRLTEAPEITRAEVTNPTAFRQYMVQELSKVRTGLDYNQVERASDLFYRFFDTMRGRVHNNLTEVLDYLMPKFEQAGADKLTNNIIQLTETSDVPATLREGARFFLDALLDLVNPKNKITITENLKNDADAVLKWLGIDHIGTWDKLKVQDREAYYDKFLDAFEKYIIEKPGERAGIDVGVQRVLRDFTSWAKGVYKKLKDSIREAFFERTGRDYPISIDEVEGVIDRMLGVREKVKKVKKDRKTVMLEEAFKEKFGSAEPGESFSLYTEFNDHPIENIIKMFENFVNHVFNLPGIRDVKIEGRPLISMMDVLGDQMAKMFFDYENELDAYAANVNLEVDVYDKLMNDFEDVDSIFPVNEMKDFAKHINTVLTEARKTIGVNGQNAVKTETQKLNYLYSSVGKAVSTDLNTSRQNAQSSTGLTGASAHKSIELGLKALPSYEPVKWLSERFSNIAEAVNSPDTKVRKVVQNVVDTFNDLVLKPIQEQTDKAAEAVRARDDVLGKAAKIIAEARKQQEKTRDVVSKKAASDTILNALGTIMHKLTGNSPEVLGLFDDMLSRISSQSKYKSDVVLHEIGHALFAAEQQGKMQDMFTQGSDTELTPSIIQQGLVLELFTNEGKTGSIFSVIQRLLNDSRVFSDLPDLHTIIEWNDNAVTRNIISPAIARFKSGDAVPLRGLVHEVYATMFSSKLLHPDLVSSYAPDAGKWSDTITEKLPNKLLEAVQEAEKTLRTVEVMQHSVPTEQAIAMAAAAFPREKSFASSVLEAALNPFTVIQRLFPFGPSGLPHIPWYDVSKWRPKDVQAFGVSFPWYTAFVDKYAAAKEKIEGLIAHGEPWLAEKYPDLIGSFRSMSARTDRARALLLNSAINFNGQESQLIDTIGKIYDVSAIGEASYKGIVESLAKTQRRAEQLARLAEEKGNPGLAEQYRDFAKNTESMFAQYAVSQRYVRESEIAGDNMGMAEETKSLADYIKRYKETIIDGIMSIENDVASDTKSITNAVQAVLEGADLPAFVKRLESYISKLFNVYYIHNYSYRAQGLKPPAYGESPVTTGAPFMGLSKNFYGTLNTMIQKLVNERARLTDTNQGSVARRLNEILTGYVDRKNEAAEAFVKARDHREQLSGGSGHGVGDIYRGIIGALETDDPSIRDNMRKAFDEMQGVYTKGLLMLHSAGIIDSDYVTRLVKKGSYASLARVMDNLVLDPLTGRIVGSTYQGAAQKPTHGSDIKPTALQHQGLGHSDRAIINPLESLTTFISTVSRAVVSAEAQKELVYFFLDSGIADNSLEEVTAAGIEELAKTRTELYVSYKPDEANRTFQERVQALEDSGAPVNPLLDEEHFSNKIQLLFNPEETSQVAVWRDGKAHIFRLLNPAFDNMFTNQEANLTRQLANSPVFGAAFRTMMASKKLFSSSVIMNPVRALFVNLPLDISSAFMLRMSSYKPFISLMAQLLDPEQRRAIWGTDDYMKLVSGLGGLHGPGTVGGERIYTGKELDVSSVALWDKMTRTLDYLMHKRFKMTDKGVRHQVGEMFRSLPAGARLLFDKAVVQPLGDLAERSENITRLSAALHYIRNNPEYGKTASERQANVMEMYRFVDSIDNSWQSREKALEDFVAKRILEKSNNFRGNYTKEVELKFRHEALSEYNKARKEVLQLNDYTRYVTGDWGRVGNNSVLNMLHSIAPFSRAAINFTASTGTALRNNPAGVMTACVSAMALGILEELLMSKLRDDDYDRRPLYEKNRNALIPIPGTDMLGRVRIDETLGLFKAFGHTLVNDVKVMQGDRKGKTSLDEEVVDLLQNYVGDILLGASPHENPLVKAALELSTGHDMFRGRAIVPPILQRVPAAQQFTYSTSTIAKWTGDLVGYSPIMIDHAIQTIFGDAVVTGARTVEATAKGVRDIVDNRVGIETLFDVFREMGSRKVIIYPDNANTHNILRYYKLLREAEAMGNPDKMDLRFNEFRKTPEFARLDALFRVSKVQRFRDLNAKFKEVRVAYRNLINQERVTREDREKAARAVNAMDILAGEMVRIWDNALNRLANN